MLLNLRFLVLLVKLWLVELVKLPVFVSAFCFTYRRCFHQQHDAIPHRHGLHVDLQSNPNQSILVLVSFLVCHPPDL